MEANPAVEAAGREAQLMQYIAFDAHKHYTLASVARLDGGLVREERVAHERGALHAVGA